MSLIKTIFHTTNSGKHLPLITLSDEEFEEFLDEHGFEVVVSEGGWNMESRENTVKTMMKLFNIIHENAISSLDTNEENSTQKLSDIE